MKPVRFLNSSFLLLVLFFHPLSGFIPQFLWQILISSLVETFKDPQTFCLSNTSSGMKIVSFQDRSASTKSFIELTEIHFSNSHEIESMGAHYARFDCDEKCQFANIYFKLNEGLNAVYFTMPARIFISVRKIVACCLHLAVLVHEDASHWHFIPQTGSLSLLQGQAHKIFNLCWCEGVVLNQGPHPADSRHYFNDNQRSIMMQYELIYMKVLWCG